MRAKWIYIGFGAGAIVLILLYLFSGISPGVWGYAFQDEQKVCSLL